MRTMSTWFWLETRYDRDPRPSPPTPPPPTLNSPLAHPQGQIEAPHFIIISALSSSYALHGCPPPSTRPGYRHLHHRSPPRSQDLPFASVSSTPGLAISAMLKRAQMPFAPPNAASDDVHCCLRALRGGGEGPSQPHDVLDKLS
jgi:hypothetical protein